MTDKKELQSIHRFYKDSKHGFSTPYGYYAIPVMGSKTKLAIVFEGEILKYCRNESSARNYIAEHKKKNK